MRNQQPMILESRMGPDGAMMAWAACLLALFVAAHFLNKAYSNAREQAARSGSMATKARVVGLAIALLVAGFAASVVLGVILILGVSFY